MDIEKWLHGLGLQQYAAAFRDNGIDADVLPELTEADLEKLGVVLGHRKRLLKAITARIEPDAMQVLRVALAPLPGNGAERRQLTVMFADLVGSTALASHFDPEDVRDVIGAYHRCVAKTVTRFGGFVAKYMGDGVLVYFGYPQAHENDAERAVRAGLKLVTKVAELSPPSNVHLRVRVGIATGLVVVGDLIGSGEAQERGVVGEAPNLAARLQTIAEPNAVVIGPRTHRLLAGLFDYHDLGVVEAKGFSEPVRAWQVLGASGIESRFEALHPAILTPLVGREEEIEMLLRRWQRARSGEGRVVLLSGEPGIGKSRIMAALHDQLQGEPHLRQRYFCSPYHNASALFPIITWFERAAGFERDDTVETRCAKLATLLARTATPQPDVALLADLLSLPSGRFSPLDLSPHRKKGNTFEALLRQFELWARQDPLLIIFEDAHWIDPTSRELLVLLTERVQCLSALLLITFRPEFDPPGVGHPHVTTLVLGRLGSREAAALVNSVTGPKMLPAEVVSQIVARSDGVPLFAEELTKTVVEGGFFRRSGERYDLDGPLPASAIPTTLYASLLSRLDRLAPAREVAQIGAAIGREFSYELLAAVAPLQEEHLQEALARLLDSGLIYGRGTPPDAIYVFKHALVQDAAYETLLKRRRQELHARIARVLEKDFPEMAERVPELLAHHCAHAGFVEKAIAYWHKAGRRAMARSAMAEAATQLTKAVELLAGLPAGADRDQSELELQVALGGALIATKGFAAPEVGRTYGRARELCRKGSESPQILPVLSGLYQYLLHVAGPNAGREAAGELLRLAERHHDDAGRAAGHRLCGASSLFCGKLALAWEQLDRALAVYEFADRNSPIFLSLPETRVACRSFMSLILLLQGYPDQALGCSRTVLAAAHDLRHAFTLSQALYLNCWLHQVRGEAPIVRDRASAMISLTAEHEYPVWLANANILHGWAVAATGMVEAGIAQMREGIADQRALGVQLHLPSLSRLLADVDIGAGCPNEALILLTEGLAVLANSGERWFEAELHRLRAEALLAVSPLDTAEAEAALHKSLGIAREQGAKLWELRSATSLARLRRDQGRCDEARDLLAPIYGWFTEGFDTPDLQRAKALLEDLRSEMR